jgi:hypothetical protein
MACGSCGGGGVTFSSAVPGSPPGYLTKTVAAEWRVTYIADGGQKVKDFGTDVEALAFMGAVGGTLSKVV